MNDEKRRVFLIRHGETDYNAERRIQGCVGNCPLNEHGKNQVELTALALKRFEFRGSRIISSGLLRAKQTARIIKEILATLSFDLKIASKKELDEMDYGNWEGKSFEEVTKLFPKEREKWVMDPTNDFSFSGAGQTFGQKRKEAIKCYNKIISEWLEISSDAKNFNNDIIIVGHGVINRIIIFDIAGISFKRWRYFSQNNCCINVIEYLFCRDDIRLKKPEPLIRTINNCSHLIDMGWH